MSETSKLERAEMDAVVARVAIDIGDIEHAPKRVCYSGAAKDMLAKDLSWLIDRVQTLQRLTERRPMKTVPRDGKMSVQFGEMLRECRRGRGFTLAELSRRCGVSKGNLSKIENGTGNVTLSTLFQLAEGLNVSAVELVFWTQRRGEK